MVLKSCGQCGNEFEFSSKERELLAKCALKIGERVYEFPEPFLCPRCSLQHRQTFRNESTLYHRTCSKSGKKIIAMYPEDAPFPVYSPEEWFGNGFDGREYGQKFDFSRPFFEQFRELLNKVPHLSMISSNNENSDFCNIVGDCKNCYLTCGSIECEDCYYGNPFRCKGCLDSLLLRDSELCLESVDSNKLYECFFCQNCSNSQNLWFCYSVQNSTNCFACANLNHAEYCLLNKQYSKEEYQKIVAEMDLTKRESVKSILGKFEKLKLEVPHRFYIGVNNEDVSGDYIFNSKDCYNSYGVSDCRDLVNCFQMMKTNDCFNVCNGEYGEQCYEIMALNSDVNRCTFSSFLWDGIDNVHYSEQCNKNVRDCFGSYALKHAQYCVLNKQYTKEEYEEIVPRIIEHMKKMGEWGRFFPRDVSPFAYNETVAFEYFPRSKDQLVSEGWKWKDFEGAENQAAKGVDESVKVCEVSGKQFKIIPQEEKFYRKYGVGLPMKAPKQRHLDRIAMRNPIMGLHDRKCDSCGTDLKSTYGADSKLRVYCEECYRKEVY